MRPLTARQKQILEFICDCVRRHGSAPTIREIATRFGFASTYAAQCHLEALAKKGYIERLSYTSRGIRLTEQSPLASGLPIVGRVAAGTPITAVENLEGFLSIESLFPQLDTLFCLRVQGDSMIDAGIWSGDYAIVRAKPDFEDGEIGVAVLDGEATVKRLRRVGRKVELIPANQGYAAKTVDPRQTEFRYAGEVIGIHRALK